MRFNIAFLGALLVIVIFAFFAYSAMVTLVNKEKAVCFQEKCFFVELAQTPEEWQMGLMYRESLDPDRGMLFVFPEEGIYPFWMKDTLIPLDIIWMDSNRMVVHIARNMQPCREDPCPSANAGAMARYVLELNAGAADRIGLKEGDSMEFFL